MFRITADGAKSYEFFNLSKVSFVHQLNAHDGVIVEESAGIFPIGADSSNDGGEMDDDIGLLLIVHPADILEVSEVVFREIGDRNEWTFPIFLESADEMRAQKSPAPRNGDLFRFKIDHSL